MLAGLLSTGITLGQPTEFAKKHEQARQQNPPGVVFDLRLKDGQTQFHPGEPITVELAFSSTLTDRYTLDAATYDRGGRLPSERWALDPTSLAIDPLAEYFRQGGMMGGLRSMPTLTGSPHVIRVELNEWLRLNQPGKYRLYDVSTRIIDQEDPCGQQSEKPVTSNIIEFEILPADEAWTAQALRQAIEILNRRSADRRPAARVVRFLDTPAAARELVKRLDRPEDDCQFEYHLGLFSSQHREVVLREMERALRAPEYPVSELFLQDYARLLFAASEPTPPPQFSINGSESDVDRQRAVYQLRQDRQMQWQLTVWQALLETVGEKRGPAQTASVVTLLSVAANWPLNLRPADWKEHSQKLRTQLASSFSQLPAQTQSTLLQYRWGWVRTPALLPALRQLVASEAEQPFQSRGLRTVALRRLYELSPDEGRKLILQEMREPKSSSDALVLSKLPDATLPDLDEVLASNLERSFSDRGNFDYAELYCYLVGRYATGAVLERVKKIYGEGHAWECDIQDPLVKYFLRVAPEYGLATLEQALRNQRTGCRHFLLSRVAIAEFAAVLEPVAIRYLSDSDPEVAADAAKVLSRYGSVAAEEPLRRRLQQFHAQWQDRADELCYHQGKANTNAAQAQLENALVESLAGGIHWLSDKPKLLSLEPLCVTPNSRQRVEGETWYWTGENTISVSSWGDREEWTVAQYRLSSLQDLEIKLAQFPQGTIFRWQPSRSDDPEISQTYEPVLHQLEAFLAGRGIRIEK